MLEPYVVAHPSLSCDNFFQMTALEVYLGSDGNATKAYYAELEKCGTAGLVAINLFRAQKCSSRAKQYRGGIRGKGSFRSMAYDRKQWSLENLCKALTEEAKALGIAWGWKEDPGTPGFEWVLYVDLPDTGKASFHSPVRGKGPDYGGVWNGQRASAAHIIQFCDKVMTFSRVDGCPS